MLSVHFYTAVARSAHQPIPRSTMPFAPLFISIDALHVVERLRSKVTV